MGHRACTKTSAPTLIPDRIYTEEVLSELQNRAAVLTEYLDKYCTLPDKSDTQYLPPRTSRQITLSGTQNAGPTKKKSPSSTRSLKPNGSRPHTSASSAITIRILRHYISYRPVPQGASGRLTEMSEEYQYYPLRHITEPRVSHRCGTDPVS